MIVLEEEKKSTNRRKAAKLHLIVRICVIYACVCVFVGLCVYVYALLPYHTFLVNGYLQ